MHPLRSAVEAALASGIDFYMVVGGDQAARSKMGFPPSVVDRQPLLLVFPARYHSYAMPTGDDFGLRCQLSFDALYHCQVPWSMIRQFVVDHSGDEKWPQGWGESETASSPTLTAVNPADGSEQNESSEGQPPFDNVRQFRPRDKRQ